jgi:hypothetical protein
MSAQINLVQLNNRSRSVIFIKSLNLRPFEEKQKIAELHKKVKLFSDKFLDKHKVPRVFRLPPATPVAVRTKPINTYFITMDIAN